jgi:hypothetical protein
MARTTPPQPVGAAVGAGRDLAAAVNQLDESVAGESGEQAPEFGYDPRQVTGGAADIRAVISMDEALDPPQRMPGAERVVWVVWRQDDHGNRAEVARHAERPEADTQASELEARGHKQTYWVEASQCSPDGDSEKGSIPLTGGGQSV